MKLPREAIVSRVSRVPLLVLLAPLALVCAVLRDARADEAVRRPPLPESLLTESATDVDATEAGELEIEANFATLSARRGGARATLVSLEAEWRVLRELGVRLEPTYARTTSAGSGTFGASGALALGLAHDFARDAHLQLELHAHTTDASDRVSFDPSDAVQPIALDLVSAKRLGRFTFRGALGMEAGGAFAHAPVHADVTAITGFLPDARLGFLALELRTDWARRNPLVIAPEVVSDLTAVGLPLRLGVALPVNVGADDARTSYGLFVRLIVLTDREAKFEQKSDAVVGSSRIRL